MRVAPALRLPAVILAVCLSCRRDPPAARGEPCPSDQVIEEVHAAIFFLERGDAAQGGSHLTAARSLAASAPHAALAAMLAPLGEKPEPGAIERARAALAAWPCLDERTHARFHARLPPLR